MTAPRRKIKEITGVATLEKRLQTQLRGTKHFRAELFRINDKQTVATYTKIRLNERKQALAFTALKAGKIPIIKQPQPLPLPQKRKVLPSTGTLPTATPATKKLEEVIPRLTTKDVVGTGTKIVGDLQISTFEEVAQPVARTGN